MKKLRRIAALLLGLLLITGTALAAKAAEIPFTLNDSETVTLVYPGPVWSIVKSDGENIAVLTEDLSWETEADIDKRVALVSAPRSGRSVVMSKASGNGRTLGRVATGNYVVILKKASGKYTGILYKGKLGYVLNSTLTYPDASQGVKLGEVCWTDGSTNGKKTINLREKTSRNSRKLAAVKTGAEVIIYGEKNDWTEVDVNGMHGYIQSKYISVTDETLTYPAAPAEKPAEEKPAETVTEEEVVDEAESPAEEDPAEADENPDDMEEEEDEEGWDEGL